MMNFVYGSGNYPRHALWFEYTHATTVDDEATYEGAITFQYRKVSAKVMKVQDINGMKDIRYENVIRTKAELPFKAKDQIKIGNEVYTIQSIHQVENDQYKDAVILFNHFNDYETEIVLE
jgi:hypothetical protein